jgi:hypothetical protein
MAGSGGRSNVVAPPASIPRRSKCKGHKWRRTPSFFASLVHDVRKSPGIGHDEYFVFALNQLSNQLRGFIASNFFRHYLKTKNIFGQHSFFDAFSSKEQQLCRCVF